MRHYDVIIIGGGPSGKITGLTGLQNNPGKKFLLIKEEKGLVPCGIPYIFHKLGTVEKDAVQPTAYVEAEGDLLIDKVTLVDIKNKTIETEKGSKFSFFKLVFATGSKPLTPTFIPGYDLDGIEYIRKSYNYMTQLKKIVDKANNIVVIGGGFIGVEVAEQLSEDTSKNVTLIEMEKNCLSRAFSNDFAIKINEIIKSTNINLLTGYRVDEFIGEGNRLKEIKISNGNKIPADLVIAAIGYRPETALAEKCGLQLNRNGAIIVDRYMRTSFEDIYAVGDCAQTEDFITGRIDNIMLASTAAAEARILGNNLFNIGVMRSFAGTLSVFSTEINSKVFASAGVIEEKAKTSNINYIVGIAEGIDRHPGSFDDTSKVIVKLITVPENGVVIGAEISGGKSAGEMINTVAFAIQKNTTVYDILSFQVGTHPLLTPAPTKYVLIKAAEEAVKKIRKIN